MKPPPKTTFISGLIRIRRQTKPPRWKDKSGKRYYEWDGFHEELEVYNRLGHHLGAVDARNGVLVKGPVKGRTIDV